MAQQKGLENWGGRGEGILKTNIFGTSTGGGGVLIKIPSAGEVWIYYIITYYYLQEVQHFLRKNFFCQVISHSACISKIEMLFS